MTTAIQKAAAAGVKQPTIRMAAEHAARRPLKRQSSVPVRFTLRTMNGRNGNNPVSAGRPARIPPDYRTARQSARNARFEGALSATACQTGIVSRETSIHYV
jgi:hypothetical protein